MQDRYAGDVGDFGKLGMLRQISQTGLTIGVNWYLTYKPEEHNNADGKHTGYLENSLFKGCDDKLLQKLHMIINGTRSVTALEEANLIQNAIYYNEILKPGNDKTFERSIWFKKSLEVFSNSDIIFCDPDNGLIVKSVSPNSKKSDKYIMHNEVFSYYQAGKSIIFYNHRCREKEEKYLQRFQTLMQKNDLVEAEWRGLTFKRGTIRDYIIVPQPRHLSLIDLAIENMMKTKWQKHFSILKL